MNLEGNRKMAIQFANKNGEKVTLFNVGPYICDVAEPRLVETDDAYIMFGYGYSDLGVDWFLKGTFKYRYEGVDEELSPDWSQGNDDEDRFVLKDYSDNPIMGNYNIEDAKGSSYFNLEALYEGIIVPDSFYKLTTRRLTATGSLVYAPNMPGKCVVIPD